MKFYSKFIRPGLISMLGCWLPSVTHDDATIGLKAALCGRCVSSERTNLENELELGTDLEDAVLYKDKKLKDQVEVAIGDGMEFTIPGKKTFTYNNSFRI